MLLHIFFYLCTRLIDMGKVIKRCGNEGFERIYDPI